jgi:cytochrome P450
MIRHPDIQRKAQAELDKVVGRGRLPEFEDKNSLPYIDALYKEVLRWHPIVPLIPHKVTVDDEYKGMRIPKGSVVVANAWYDIKVHAAPCY